MAAIDYLRARGFSARAKGNRLSVSPASRITAEVRQFIKLHRLDLLAEVAANDGQERRSNWRVILGGRVICTMIGEPMTYAEALDAAGWRWPEAEVKP